MDDLKESLINCDIDSICKITSELVCQNRVKQLVVFFIKEFNEFYINGFLHSILFFHTRLNTIQKVLLECKQKPYQSRVLRTSICELFVMLSQIPRKQVQYRNVKQKNVNYVNVPSQFSFRVNQQHITNSETVLNHLKTFYYSDSSFDDYLKILLYHVTCSKDQGEILNILNVITTQIKTSISVNLFDQPKMKHIASNESKGQQDIVFLLFYMVIELCSDEKIAWCQRILDIYSVDYKKGCRNHRFNLLLLAYSICSCDNFTSTFMLHNKYCNAKVLECAFKIDFHYMKIAETNANISINHGNKCKDDDGLQSSNLSEHESETDTYIDLLFSSPQKDTKMRFYMDKIRSQYNDQQQLQTVSTKVITCCKSATTRS